MKVALLLPGYLDSPDYLHMMIFEKRLKELGYVVERMDPCNLWQTGDINNYSITNFLKQIEEKVDSYKNQNPEEFYLLATAKEEWWQSLPGAELLVLPR